MSDKPTKGTVVSFGNTPQAKDDTYAGLGTEDTGSIIYLDVMANDLAGNGKSLWATDDGISEGGIRPVDLLTQDAIGAVGASRLGAEIWITADGKIAYRMTDALRTSLQSLAVGQTATDSFTYAIQMGNGTISWAQASFTVTGTNDTPIVQNVSIAAVEDGPAVTGSFNGDDVDSDDDGSTLQYTLTSQPAVGALSNNGNGTFTYNSGSNFHFRACHR
jgi:VCBS repeat-containing protein